MDVGTELSFVDLAANKHIDMRDKKRMHVCLLKVRLGYGDEAQRRTSIDVHNMGTRVIGTVLDDPPRFRVEFSRPLGQYHLITLKLPSDALCTACGDLPTNADECKCPCGVAMYCSKDCQRRDWRQGGHKDVHLAIMDLKDYNSQAGRQKLCEEDDLKQASDTLRQMFAERESFKAP